MQDSNCNNTGTSLIDLTIHSLASHLKSFPLVPLDSAVVFRRQYQWMQKKPPWSRCWTGMQPITNMKHVTYTEKKTPQNGEQRSRNTGELSLGELLQSIITPSLHCNFLWYILYQWKWLQKGGLPDRQSEKVWLARLHNYISLSWLSIYLHIDILFLFFFTKNSPQWTREAPKQPKAHPAL